jgi:hypothetical protein
MLDGKTPASDGSFTTTSTSIADKLKMLKQNKRMNINATPAREAASREGGKPNESFSKSENNDPYKQTGVPGIGKGPVKAIRQ